MRWCRLPFFTITLAIYSSHFIKTDYLPIETEVDTAETTSDKKPQSGNKQTDDAGIGYVEQLIFITDNSVSQLGKSVFTGVPNPENQVWPSEEGNVDCTKLNLSRHFEFPATGERLTFVEGVKVARPRFVILTFGSYCGGIFDDQNFISSYSDFIKSIKAASPNTDIIVQSILTVCTTCRVINNEEVIRRNKLLVEICEEYHVYYLDIHSVLSNEYGVLLADYTGASGYSLNENGCRKMIEYIRLHAHPSFGN